MSDFVSFYIPGTKSFETDNDAGKITLTDSKDAKSSIVIPRSKIASAKRIYDTLVVDYAWDGTYPDNPDNPTPPDPSKPYYDPNYPDDPWWGIESNNGNIDTFLDKFDLMSTDHSGKSVKIQDHVRWHEYTDTDLLEIHHIVDIYVHHKWTDSSANKTYDVTVKDKYDICYELGTFGYVDLQKWRRKGDYLYRYGINTDEPERDSYYKRFQKAFPTQYYSLNEKYYQNDFGAGSPMFITLCRCSVKKIKGMIKSVGYDDFNTTAFNIIGGTFNADGAYTEKDKKIESVNTSVDPKYVGSTRIQLIYDYIDSNGRSQHVYPVINPFYSTETDEGVISSDSRVSDITGTSPYSVSNVYQEFKNNRGPFSYSSEATENSRLLAPDADGSNSENISYRIINTITIGNVL